MSSDLEKEDTRAGISGRREEIKGNTALRKRGL